MKTKTTQTTKIGASTKSRNLFQKTFILLAILAFTSFGFKAKAQAQLEYRWDNTATTCDWDVNVYDNSLNLLFTFTMTAGNSLGPTCQSISAPIAYVEFTNPTWPSLGLNSTCTTGCLYAIGLTSTSCGGISPTDELTVGSTTTPASCSLIPPVQILDFRATP
jgi:hypothetical protein